MQEISFEEALAQIQAKDPRYTRDAYLFVREALDHTQKAIAKSARRVRHVTGQELLQGIREFALQQFGPMTKTLLEEWGVHCCQDFGEIVFNMIEVSWLAKTEKDSRTDFSEGYDFDEAFVKPFLPKSKQTIRIPAAKSAQSPKANS
jgi:uncharacterized repeat protein (TIGR04138 family)